MRAAAPLVPPPPDGGLTWVARRSKVAFAAFLGCLLVTVAWSTGRAPDVRGQHRVAVPEIEGRLVDDGRAAASPIVLAYHDIAPGDRSPFTVDPGVFARQMAMLRAAGYEAVSGRRFRAWLEGRGDLPPRAVLITFDDAAAGVWTWADPVLERFGMRAVVFAISDSVDSSRYYLTWKELDRMDASGRWEVEAHSHDMHHLIGDGPALVSRTRGETEDAYRTRVRADLRRNLGELAERRFGRAGLFAYPFSATTPVVEAIAKDYFPVRFVASRQVALARVVRSAATPVARFEVTAETPQSDLCRLLFPDGARC